MTSFVRFSCAAATAIALFAAPTLGMAAENGEVDPGQVSEGLKAIFSYGHATSSIKDRLNANTVTLMSGTIGGTYVQIGADLSSALDDGDKLRVLSIVGRGSVQGIADVLYLRGVDLGIVRSDTLDFLEKKGIATNIKSQLTYVTKLYNEEMHVVAPKNIQKLSDLAGKTVSVDLPNGGTFITAITVFERLGIKANFVYIEQRRAYEKLRNGEIDAMIAVQGVPSKFTTTIKDERFHLVPVEFAPALQGDYFPAELRAEDYPALIPAGQRIDTIAVPCVLAAYNWDPGNERYRKVEHFVQAFFDKFRDLQKPPYHPKWKEVALTAPLKGWKRFPAAQTWLDQHVTPPTTELRRQFEELMAVRASQGDVPKNMTAEQKTALFEEFLEWQKDSSKQVKKHRATSVAKRKTRKNGDETNN